MSRALVSCLAGTVAMVTLAGLTAGVTTLASPAAARAGAPALIQQSFADAAAARDFDVAGPGAWVVATGRYRSDVAGAGASARALAIHRTPVPSSSWQLTTSVRAEGTQPSVPAVVFDFKDSSNFSYVQLAASAAASGVFTVRSGVPSRVAPLAAAPVAGAASVVELRKAATVLKVYVGRSSATIAYVGKTTVPSTTRLRVGYAVTGGSASFDDLTVTSSGTATPTPTPTPTPSASPTPAPSATPTPTGTPPTAGRAVAVATSGQLTAALAEARPGDHITMADGVYTTRGLAAPVAVGGKSYVGTFVASRSGTAAQPIVLSGSRRAEINGMPGADGTGTQYGLYLVGANHWQVKGFTVTNVSKGIVLDRSQHSSVEDMDVHRTGQEGIHLRALSSDNVVRGNTVHLTGQTSDTYGEGIYVGSASSNWATYSGGLPDASDRNQLIGNTITATSAESMDIKEGTTGGLISGNTFDGALMTGSWADSWIDLKGNGWLVTGNHGTNALQDGFQVHGALPGWGLDNSFRDNVADVNAAGYGFWLQSNVTGNVVSCANTVTRAGSGLANVACR